MSKYTTQLRFICETLSGLDESVGYNDVETVIATARPLLFGNYEIFDPLYKPILETKIINHFYTREISGETFSLWKLWLNNKMKEIMPYYNQLYKSALLEFDPLTDTKYTIEHHGKGTNDRDYNEQGKEVKKEKDTETLKDRETTHDTTYDKFSDTPQGALTNVQNDKYLTNARMIINDGTDNLDRSKVDNIDATINNDILGGSQSKSTDEYFDTIVGKRSNMSYPELLQKYRDTFLNIDMLIIDELEELFIHLW